MEKESNTNCMEETATMPSYFPCIKSSESHPLADWLYLKSVITSSPELRMMTETYRKRLAISKQFADQYKPEMPAITVSALMNGYGRQLADFLKPTYMLQLGKHPTPMTIQLHPQCLLGIQSILRNWTFLIFKQV